MKEERRREKERRLREIEEDRRVMEKGEAASELSGRSTSVRERSSQLVASMSPWRPNSELKTMPIPRTPTSPRSPWGR